MNGPALAVAASVLAGLGAHVALRPLRLPPIAGGRGGGASGGASGGSSGGAEITGQAWHSLLRTRGDVERGRDLADGLAARWLPLLTPTRLSVVAGVAGLLIGVVTTSVALAILTGVAAALAGRGARRHGADLEIRRTEGHVIAIAAGVAVELRAGLPPPLALAAAARHEGQLGAAVAAAAATAVDLPAALGQIAALPGAHGLRALAACWQVGEHGGVGLADAVNRVERALRAELGRRERLTSAMAGPVAAARLLAGLPVLGIALGAALGLDPIGFLTRTSLGQVSLLTGAGLDLMGLVWVRRLVTHPAGRP